MMFSFHLISMKSYICCYFFRFEFTLNMFSTSIKLYLNDMCYSYGYVSNDFIILDVINIIISYNTIF
jgi:hypothetical protein